MQASQLTGGRRRPSGGGRPANVPRGGLTADDWTSIPAAAKPAGTGVNHVGPGTPAAPSGPAGCLGLPVVGGRIAHPDRSAGVWADGRASNRRYEHHCDGCTLGGDCPTPLPPRDTTDRGPGRTGYGPATGRRGQRAGPGSET